MGSGIAQVFASHGFTTLLYDLNREMLHRAQSGITSSLQALVNKNKITVAEKADTLSRIRFVNDVNDCKAGLVIEAIVEKLPAKTELFAQLAAINKPDTILVTNTSSLSVKEIAAGVTGPERFAGMHFFNPATAMKLVEIIDAGSTSRETIQFLTSIAGSIGKTAVLCQDSPGFIVNRVARPYYLEALYLVENGICDFSTIDRLMEASGFKMGPFKLMDLIGNDINYSVTQIVYDALGRQARLKPSALQETKVKEGSLGRKTGKGYYEY
jgi:3-hydroxybutyryl-CoA dehydrogenase